MLSGWKSSWTAAGADDSDQECVSGGSCRSSQQNIYEVLGDHSAGDSDDAKILIAKLNEQRAEESDATAGAEREEATVVQETSTVTTKKKVKHNRKKGRYRKSGNDKRRREIVLTIYLEKVELRQDGELHPVLEVIYASFPLVQLAPASTYVQEQLKGVPHYTYATSYPEVDLFIPAVKVTVTAVKKILNYIRSCYLPYDNDFDLTTIPKIPLPEQPENDIRALCDLYQVWHYLGMKNGQLSHQPDLVTAIIDYFRPDQDTITPEDVLYFWRACKDDVELTWRVMQQVLASIARWGRFVDQKFAKCFETEQELRFLWENRCGERIVLPDPEPFETEEAKWQETVASWEEWEKKREDETKAEMAALERFYGYEIDWDRI